MEITPVRMHVNVECIARCMNGGCEQVAGMLTLVHLQLWTRKRTRMWSKKMDGVLWSRKQHRYLSA